MSCFAMVFGDGSFFVGQLYYKSSPRLQSADSDPEILLLSQMNRLRLGKYYPNMAEDIVVYPWMAQFAGITTPHGFKIYGKAVSRWNPSFVLNT